MAASANCWENQNIGSGTGQQRRVWLTGLITHVSYLRLKGRALQSCHVYLGLRMRRCRKCQFVFHTKSLHFHLFFQRKILVLCTEETTETRAALQLKPFWTRHTPDRPFQIKYLIMHRNLLYIPFIEALNSFSAGL